MRQKFSFTIFNIQNLSLKITKSLGQHQQHTPMYSTISSSIWFIILHYCFLQSTIIQAIDNNNNNGGGGSNKNLLMNGNENSCPVRSLIKPCLCNEITKGLEIICEGVQLETLKDIFNRLPSNNNNNQNQQQQQRITIMYLKMKNNYIHSFPARLLNNINVRHLMAHNCNMIDVEQDAFRSISEQIESLDLSHNKFKKVSK